MAGASFSTPPVVYSQSGHEMVAAATKDGARIPAGCGIAQDGDRNLCGNHDFEDLGSKRDRVRGKTQASHTRWILLPASGSATGIVAFKVTGDTKPTLQQAWTANVASPSAPVVVNGVVFAKNDGSATAPAVLYAIDGATGKELWNSGKAITSSSKTNLWSISGQVYVATSDATVYAFGTPQGRSPGE